MNPRRRLKSSAVLWEIIFGIILVASVALAQDLKEAGTGATDATKKLLVNGSFENGTDGWTFETRDKHGQVSIDPQEKHGDRPTLRVDNPQGDDSHIVQKVKVEPQTKYRLEGYIKTKDVKTTKHEGQDGACLEVDGTQSRTQLVWKNNVWTRVSCDFVTANETEIGVTARLGVFSSPVSGTAWFSELALIKLGKVGPRH